LRILIAGGGTGGHYFPALAVAYELADRGHSVFFVGSERGIEGRLGFPPAESSILLPSSSFRGKGLKSLLSIPGYFSSLFKALSFAKRHKPELSIVFGGYSSLPVGLASALLKLPLFIQEQNSVPGKTNRYLSRFAAHAYLGFPSASSHLSCPSTFTGNPLRREVTEIALKVETSPETRKFYRKRLNLHPERKTLLVIGGSQGALWLNQFLETAIPRLPKEVQVIHLTGPGKEGRLKELYRARGIPALVLPFHEKPWELYAAADAAVSRSGALAMSELAAFKIPTLFVPYPFAADQHQLKNALYLAGRGGAFVHTQEELTLELFLQRVETLLFDIITVGRMKEVMGELFPLNARQKIADELEEWKGKRS